MLLWISSNNIFDLYYHIAEITD